VTGNTAPRKRLAAPERRALILAAAREVFGTRGFHGTSIDDIAGAASVSKALIYEHFASKQDLHDSLLAEEAQELFGRLAAGTRVGDDEAARLRSGVDAFFSFVEERGAAWRMLVRDQGDPERGGVFDRLQEQATTVIAALMRAEAGPRAAEHALELEMLAQQLSGAVQALGNWWLHHPDVPRVELVDRVMDFAWTGLERLREQV